jgi:GTP-binding protein
MASQKAPGMRTVVLVGRPNVGKSTLFNRITGTRRACVAAIAGTTRDIIAAQADWQGAHVTVVDTGGMFGASKDPLHELVLQQGHRAIASADLIVFVVDGKDGLVSGDEEIAATVRQSGRPVVLAVNKTDDRKARARIVEFYVLGFDPVVPIASEHGEGIGDLLDAVTERLALGKTAPPAEAAETKVAIIGRPNVGKSSLVNRLLKEERMVVSEMAGTTRDPVDSILKWHKQQFRIVDTAGIRRAGKVARSGEIETVSVMLARRAIARADVAVLLIDAMEGPTDQDATVAGEAERTGCGVIIAVNKWDLVEDRSHEAARRFDDHVKQTLKFLDYAPVLHISARTGDRTPRLLEAIDRVAKGRLRRVPTSELNRFVEAVTTTHAPVSPGKKNVRVLYAAQTGVAPPTFVFFTNVATTFHFSYERFLANRLRESFGFEGTPIRLEVRARKRAESRGDRNSDRKG